MIQTKKIQSNLSIYDYSQSLYGGFDNIITLIQLNPQFINMNVNLDYFVPQELTYDDQYFVDQTPQIQLTIAAPASTIKIMRGYSLQNIYDLNLMAYSGFDSLVKFMQDNGVLNVNVNDFSLKSFLFDTTFNLNLSLSAIIAQKGYIFTSGNVPSNSIEEPFLKQENGFYILQENGFKIIIT